MRLLLPVAILLLCGPLSACAAPALVTAEVLPPPSGAMRESGPDVKFLGGLDLDSIHDSFGGISGITLLSQHRFLAVTDRGWWVMGDLVRKPGSGELTGVFNVRMEPMRDGTGKRPGRRYRDAEGIRLAPDGTVLVSFENKPRLASYGKAGEAFPENEKRAWRLPEWKELTPNRSLESVAAHPDGGVFVIVEGDSSEDTTPGWLFRDGKPVCTAVYHHQDGLVPVDATFLPDGSLLVLERALGFQGWRARLKHYDWDEQPEGAACRRVLDKANWQAELPSHWPLDNFEGMAAEVLDDGRVRAFLITDDNFKPVERTLLLHVELAGLRLR